MVMMMKACCRLLVFLSLLGLIPSSAAAAEPQRRSLQDDFLDDESSTAVPSMALEAEIEEMEEELLEEILEEGSMSPSGEESVLEAFGLEDEQGDAFELGEGEDAEDASTSSISENFPEENVVDEVSMQDVMGEEEENALESTEEEAFESSTTIEVSETAESPTTASETNITTLDVEVGVIEEELDNENETDTTQSTETSTAEPTVEEPEYGSTTEESEPTEPAEYYGETETNETPPYQAGSTTTTTTSSTYDTSAYEPVNVDKEDAAYIPPSDDPLDEIKEQEEDIADQWHKEDWSNKTPQELAALAEVEADKIMHDKYVPLVAVAVAVVCFAFLFVVVQQLVENPNGCLSKTCKCTVAFFRIISWPVRMILCCGLCCGSSAREPDHQLLGDSEHMSKNGRSFSDDDLEFV